MGHAHFLLRPEDTWASCSLPALSDGHAQRIRAAGAEISNVRGLPGRTCPFFVAARGHLGLMLTACAERWTCPTTAAGPEGHAHSSLRPEDTWASCSVPLLSDGHAQRASATREEMPTLEAQRWTYPTGAGYRGGHVHSRRRRLGMSRGPWPLALPGGAGACPLARPFARLLAGYWSARSSKSTSSPSSSSVFWPSSFRCRNISTAPAAASRMPAMRKMMPPSRAAA